MHYLAVCAIFRDEAPYLTEWLLHYELQGVEHFYLYDDNSADKSHLVLKSWVDRGMVTLEKVPMQNRRQRYAYEHCIRTHRNDSRWIAFLDIDEFAFARNRPENLAEIMPRYEQFPGLAINWVCYGSSGLERPPSPLVCANYQLRSRIDFRTSEKIFLTPGMPEGRPASYFPYNGQVKTIARMDAVEGMLSPHSFRFRNGAPAVSPTGQPVTERGNDRLETEILRINHYWSKSQIEFRRKLARRRPDTDEFYNEDTAFLREAAMNQEYDPSILEHSRKVAERLGLDFAPGTEVEWLKRQSYQQARDINAEAEKFSARRQSKPGSDGAPGKRTGKRHYLAVCAIFRDEARYLAEWLTHYELQGVEHFYLYDDNSADRPEDVLKPWLDRGIVTLEKVPMQNRRQRYAYEHCILNHRQDAHWVGFLDIDEFAFIRNRPENLAEIMTRYERFPGLALNWVCYGSSGFETQPGSLVTASYQLRGHMDFRTSEQIFLKPGMPEGQIESYFPYNGHIKSIVRMDAVEGMISPHSFIYRNEETAVSPSGAPILNTALDAFSERIETDVLRINHYWSKSMSEFRAKLSRGRADIDAFYKDDISFLREAAMNQIYDPSILEHSKAVAGRLGIDFNAGTETEWRTRESFQQARDINAEVLERAKRS